MHSRRSGKRFKPWILAEGGCLSFIVVIPTADSSAAGTGGTPPDAIEAAINYVDMPLRLDKADAVPEPAAATRAGDGRLMNHESPARVHLTFAAQGIIS
ncbi:MAG: hypothetical protein CR217_01800 [Beijerinckiaceae bacterium]|nr:MAG: hypothetical protein CR217_01800 [Beijerinckiaceae bacterium]